LLGRGDDVTFSKPIDQILRSAIVSGLDSGMTQYSKLPQFLAVGPGRTGTTWLHEALEGRVDLPYGVKETQFFNYMYDKGFDWYVWHFRYATGTRPVGEICPYFAEPLAPGRIKQHLPDCRIIICLRDPVDRAYSNYKLLRAYAWARGPLEEVIETRPHLDHDSHYAEHVKRWFDTFGRDRVLITWYEDLASHPQEYLDRFCEFTGIEKFTAPKLGSGDKRINEFSGPPRSRRVAQNARHVLYWLRDKRAYRTINALENAGVWNYCFSGPVPYPRLTPEQDAMLRQRYLPEVEALEKLLDCDLSRWKKPRPKRAA
jgi:Sulfotransferase domain